jgi:hypothetical protein
MTALTQSTRRKRSLLQLAEELGNVSKACRIRGYHRDTFYEVRRACQVGGVAGLVEERRGPKGPHPNRVDPEVEEKILAYSLEHPTHGQQRVANELRLQTAPTHRRLSTPSSGLAAPSFAASSPNPGPRIHRTIFVVVNNTRR